MTEAVQDQGTPTDSPVTPEGTQEPAPSNYIEQVEALRKEFEEKFKAPDAGPKTVEQPKEEPTPEEFKPQDFESPLDFSIQLIGAQTKLTEDNFVDSIRNALKHSDDTLIDYDKLTQGLTPEQAHNAKYIAKSMYKEAQDRTASIQKSAYDTAGGKEQWESAVSAFQTSAGKAVQLQARALEQGGYIKEAVDLVLSTVRDLGLVVHKGQPSLQCSGKTAPPKTLSGEQYRTEIGNLIKQYGTNFLSDRVAKAKYQELTAQYKPN